MLKYGMFLLAEVHVVTDAHGEEVFEAIDQPIY